MVDAHGGATANTERPGTVYATRQARPSYVGRVHPPPSWTDQDACLASFAEGTSNNHGDLTERPGRNTRASLPPLPAAGVFVTTPK
jgi:hypothetical protein